MSHKLHVTIEDTQYEGLRDLSSEVGASIGELVRRALKQVYGGDQDRDRRLAAFDTGFGAWSNRPDDADTYEEIRKMRRKVKEW